MDKIMGKIIPKVLREAVKLKSDEHLLIIYDKPKEKIAKMFFNAGKKITHNVDSKKINVMDITSKEPGKNIVELMKKADVVLYITSVSLTHTRATEIARKHGVRIASMPGINEKMFSALDVDYKKLRNDCKKIATLINKTNEIRMETRLGSYLILKCKGRIGQADDGILDKKGGLHNLPAGECGVAPIENSANGVVVVDCCMAGVGKMKNPLKIFVKNGRIVEIKGSDAAKMKSILRKSDKNAKILCEFSIGLNPKARPLGIILNDEKIFGTCHVAFGDNKNIGGKNRSNVHLDGVINKPTIWFDDKLIMKNGLML